MSNTPPPSQVPDFYVPMPRPCEHCATGIGEHSEAWHWLLIVGEGGPVVELARDGIVKLQIPITDAQLEELMDRPVTLTDVLKDGI